MESSDNDRLYREAGVICCPGVVVVNVNEAEGSGCRGSGTAFLDVHQWPAREMFGADEQWDRKWRERVEWRM